MLTNTNSNPKRSEISRENTWDLTPLCADETTFSEALSLAESNIEKLAAFRGKISRSAADLQAYLEERDAQLLVADRLYSYAFQYSDEDTANTAAQAMKSRLSAFILLSSPPSPGNLRRFSPSHRKFLKTGLPKNRNF